MLPTARSAPRSLCTALAQLEMILQAHEYEQSQGKQLDEFFASTAGKWRTELGRQWAAEIVGRRDRCRAGSGGSVEAS